MSKLKLHALLKFGNEQHISDLYTSGTVFFNPIEKFRLEEDGNLRGDIYEGNSWVSNLLEAEVKLLTNDAEVSLGTASSVHLRGFKEQIRGNIFSMYAIHPALLSHSSALSFDRRILGFGSHFIAIRAGHIQTFLEKIWRNLEGVGIQVYGAGLVSYYDEEVHPFLQTDLFMKRKEYSFQNEFRIFSNNELSKPFFIKIGSLQDIATIHETSSIFSLSL